MTTQLLRSNESLPTRALHWASPDSAIHATLPEIADGDLLAARPAAIRQAALELLQLADRLEAAEPDRITVRHTSMVPVLIDADSHRVWVADELVELRHQEFRLLQVLVVNSGKVLTRHQLIDLGWHTTTHSSHRTVDVHIRRLRLALGLAATRVTTVRSIGYRYD